jgi:hypothetical protein
LLAIWGQQLDSAENDLADLLDQLREIQVEVAAAKRRVRMARAQLARMG